MRMEEDNVCCVCFDTLSEGGVHRVDECGHTFHSSCYIRWLQQGNLSCPICRTDVNDRLPSHVLSERRKYMRQYSRRKSAPKDLKNLVKNIQAVEQKYHFQKQQIALFKREHSDLIKEEKRLDREKRAARSKLRHLNIVLGLFQMQGLTLPALSVVQFYQFETD